MRTELLDKIAQFEERYDEKEGLISTYHEKFVGGYHTRRTGLVHETNLSAEYAAAVLYSGKKELFGRAKRIFLRLAQLQDTRPQSKTFGLWSYYMEEDLDNMRAPDFNFSDFIGKNFIYALKKHEKEFDINTLEIMKTALSNAMRCSIKRNVSPDYSNISMMSCMTIISAAEILGDEEMFNYGKKRLQKAYRYNKYNGAFSEYNSSTYTPLAIAELTRMLEFFNDDECIKMAEELHEMAWENLSLYYNNEVTELSPPQKRSYRDIDNGEFRGFIYIATGGRYGSADDVKHLSLPNLMLPIKCPEKLLDNFKKTDMFLEKTYYRKNDIRTPDEDTVIVRSLDSPDLKAYTYITPKYSFGAFDKSDLWNQRRTCMVVWNSGGKIRTFRLRCINGDYDFCSGVVSVDMQDNVMIGNIGFVNDHGDFHYILDKTKDGRIFTQKLAFRFEAGGDTGGVNILQNGDEFKIYDDDLEINLKILDWFYDGKKAEILFNKEERYIELIGYAGEEKEIDLNKTRCSAGSFVMSVNGKLPKATCVVSDGIVKTTAETTRILEVQSYADITSFDKFMGIK